MDGLHDLKTIKMQKEFNITGICRPAQHYMADISHKLAATLQLVERGKYFIINRPRQYGKTTMLYTLARSLREQGDYVVFNISFEGLAMLFLPMKRFLHPVLLIYYTSRQPFFTPN